MEYIQDSLFGKTYSEPLAPTKARTSASSSNRSSKSSSRQPLCLRFRKADGHTPTAGWETDGAWAGELSTRNIGESPNVAVVSTLSQILEEDVPERYCLSATATLGILRRASRRGKEMPLMLETALIQKTIEGEDFGQAEIADAREILRAVRETVGAENARKWIRAALLVQQAEVLQSEMCEQEKDSGRMPCVIGELDAGTCKKNCGGRSVCGLWQGMQDGSASHRRESVQQLARKFSSLMQKLSLKETQDAVAMYCLRTACESEGALHETLPAVQKRETRKDCGAESLGYFAEGRAPWQRAAADAPRGTEICDSTSSLIPYTLKIRSGCEGGGKGALIQENKAATLATNNDQYLFVPTFAIPINDKATRWRGGGKTRNGDGSGNGLGVGKPGDPAPTITAGDRHAVAYRMRGFGDYVEDETASAIKQRDYKDCTDCIVFDKEVYNSGDSSTGGHYISDGGPAPTLRACSHPPRVCTRFIVRRLTPTECTRLQGFFDHWGDVTPLDVNNPAELAFWREVYKLDCQIKGKKISASIMTKPERLAKWHDNLHSDASEYKLWGNGIALPCALYVMQGIEEVLRNA